MGGGGEIICALIEAIVSGRKLKVRILMMTEGAYSLVSTYIPYLTLLTLPYQ